MNSAEFEKHIKDFSGTLLDVRTIGEFKNGHIEEAGQLNYYALDFRQKLLLLPKNQPIYLYCNTGYRSLRAAEILAENGYEKVFNLEHGIMEWNLKNLPIQVEPDAKPDTENKMELDEFTALINSGELVFVDFYAPWCAPCRKMMPMIDSLKTEYNGQITVVKINADASKRLMKSLSIQSVPNLILYKNGKSLFTHTGIISKSELENVFKANISSRIK
ncbi:thioredoxin domain-containing protein [Perlabentimonas gracilis]|uniref:thioredoxin domain-containing protein n=1 Tax=Perlabentimonas gracilis TaxID=2715279 RepID=UPI001408BD7A|nr:thioredoxin domain-containing protein [Perlabentimonas gracilis]NHB70367.1 thioredoxin fold domain-containing protein [Perlabentimonas gracilis]